MAEKEFVQVAFPIPIPETFTYLVPEGLKGKVALGSHVAASLGRRRLAGIVVGFEPREGLKNLKQLDSLVRPEPVLEPGMLELARKVADHYLCPLGEILAAAYPAHAEKGPRFRGVPDTVPGGEIEGEQHHSLETDLGRYFAPVIEASDQRVNRIFVTTIPDRSREKTYAYLVSRIIRTGGGVIFLVPEVSTSGFLVELLKERFGKEVELFHSRLRISERKRIWEECRSGRLKVLIGTRSAVFLPVRGLKLFVVEDEHAGPYKQEETPRYNGRDVAIMRGQVSALPVLLASATPSLESVWAMKAGEYRLLEAVPVGPVRPAVRVVDMRNRENIIPQSEELSRPLISAMEKALGDHKKVLLFLNRRGFYSWVQCQECGFVETCPSCGLPMICHSEDKSLVCHRCSHKALAPSSCTKCGSTRFRYGGGGVEKVQTRLKRFFPAARVARMDFDTARTRPDAMRIAGGFAEGKIDILIGTLMVTKGLRLGAISLGCVIRAEAQLNIPDFRSGERAFQLLSEVVSLVGDSRGAGVGARAAGAELTDGEVENGEIIIQTLNPDHHSVLAVVRHDPDLFYEQELRQRKELGYPPFSSLIAFHVSGTNEEQVMKIVEQMGSAASEVCERRQGAVQILGPSPGIPPKLKGRIRWHMSIRAEAREEVVGAAKEILALFGGKHEVAGVTISVDVDPVGV